MEKDDKLIFLIVDCAALIQDEKTFFEICFKKLLKSKEGKNLKDKNLTVFIHVDAGLSSGNQIYHVENNIITEANDEKWEEIRAMLKSLKINSNKSLIESKELEKYVLSI